MKNDAWIFQEMGRKWKIEPNFCYCRIRSYTIDPCLDRSKNVEKKNWKMQIDEWSFKKFLKENWKIGAGSILAWIFQKKNRANYNWIF